MEDHLSRRKKPKLKLACSFNGNFQPRPPSGKLRYTGGESRIISVDRNIGFSRLKLMVLELIRCPDKFQHSFSLMYRLQDSESADGYAPALVVSDDDVRCMVDQYEKLEFYGKHCRLWIFVCNNDMYVQFGKIINGFMNFGESESLNRRVGVLCNKNGFDGDKNKTFLKNETLSVNEKSLVKLCGCHFGGEKVRKMVTIVDKVKSSENSLRKIVLKQQLLAKQSGRVWSSHRGLGLCIEQGEMERANCDNEKYGQSLTDLSSEPDSSLGFNSTNPSFVGSSFRDSILGYKYNITNFVESENFANFVPLLVSHSHPLNSKDGNPHVALNSAKHSLSGQSNLNLGNPATCNSSWSIGMLLFHEPSSMVSCYDDKCESRSVELASLSNTDSENIIPWGGDSKTLRAGLVPCSCSNQLDKSINPAKSLYGSSHGGIRNHRFGLNDARNQRNCRYLFRNHRNNLNEMGSQRNTKLDGRPWMGKFYPGLRSSSSISKQGQVMRSCYPTLSKPWSDSFNQQVLGEPRTLEYVLNNEQDKVTDQQDFAKIINYPNQTGSPTLDGNMASSMNFSLHNLSLSSLNDEEQPTPFGSSSYISEAFLKPQSKAFDLMNEEHLSSAPQVQNPSGGPSISSSDKAVKLQKDNDKKSEPQHELEFTSSIDEKEEIKRTHEGSKVNGRIPTELAAVYNHLATKELQTIENSDLEYIKELGSGTYGTVFHGKWKGSDVAIKKLKPSCFSGCSVEEDRLVADFWKEAQLLGQLHHPNIVALYGVVTAGPVTNLATVTEYMVNGSLRQVLRRKDRTIDRRKRLIVAMDSAFGMEYLHEKNIVHFDLKSYNFLVNMRDPQRPVCKIGDLGLSKIKQKTLVSGGVRGTIPWMAPELLNGKNMVTEKVDVYSFGIVMWELLTCEEPYTNMRSHEILAGIIKGTLRPEIPSWCDPAWRSLMERCWSSDPDARPAFSEIARELRAMAAAMNIK